MIGLRRALLAAALVVVAPLVPLVAHADTQPLTLGTASAGGTYYV